MMGLRRRRPRLSPEDERVLTMAKGAARAGIWGLAPAQSAEEQAAAAGTPLPGEAGDAVEAFPPGEPLVLSAPPAALAAADAEFMRQFPALIAHGEASGRRRLGPVWHATPAAETRPMSAVPADVPPPPARETAPPLPRRQPALPRRRPARPLEESPFHDALLKEWRTPLGDPARPAWRPPHDATVARRIGDAGGLAYPKITGFTTPGADDLYAELLRHASVITGTTGIGSWPHSAPGGAA